MSKDAENAALITGINYILINIKIFIYLFSHLADAFIQSDLQMRINTNQLF